MFSFLSKRIGKDNKRESKRVDNDESECNDKGMIRKITGTTGGSKRDTTSSRNYLNDLDIDV